MHGRLGSVGIELGQTGNAGHLAAYYPYPDEGRTRACLLRDLAVFRACIKLTASSWAPFAPSPYEI
jgi:hypothetical protein